jgi:hypothetical protein
MIKVFKLLNGEELISEATGNGGNSYTLKDPAAIVIQQTAKGVGVALAPYMPYANSEITLYVSGIVSESTPNGDMENEYRRIFGSGIEVVSSVPKIVI